MNIKDSIRKLQKAMDDFGDAANDLQPGPQRQVSFNILHYMRQDFRLIQHAFNMDKEEE